MDPLWLCSEETSKDKLNVTPFYSNSSEAGLLSMYYDGENIEPGIQLGNIAGNVNIDQQTGPNVKLEGNLYNLEVNIKITEDHLTKRYLDLEVGVGPSLEIKDNKIQMGKVISPGIGVHLEQKIYLLPGPIPKL